MKCRAWDARPILTSNTKCPFKSKGAVTLCNFSCNLSHNGISTNVFTLWNGCYTEQRFMKRVSFRWSHEVKRTFSLAGAANRCDTSCRCYTAQCLKNWFQPLRKVEPNSILLSTTASQRFLAVARYVTSGNDSFNFSRNGVATQVARRIAQCNSALSICYLFVTKR